MKKIIIFVFILITLNLFSDARLIKIDGDFSDWQTTPDYSDTVGDIGSGTVDFKDIFIANDENYLYIRFSITNKVDIDREGKTILYIDTDNNSSTGESINGIGADLVWKFASKKGTFYGNNGSETVYWTDLDYLQSSIISTSEYELRFKRDAVINEENVFSSDTIKIVLADKTGDTDNDFAPDSNSIIYTFDNGAVEPYVSINIDKENSNYIRVLTFNVAHDYENNEDAMWEEPQASAISRILNALEPQIILFQEINTHNADETTTKLEELYPAPSGYSWHTISYYDSKISSLYPITQEDHFANGNIGGLIDLPAEYQTDIYLFCCHLKALSGYDETRQKEADTIMQFVRDDIKQNLPNGTPVIIGGDMNFVDGDGPLHTFITGDIYDNSTYGDDFSPDWDNTDFTEIRILHSHAPVNYTEIPSTSYFPGKLDYFIYSDAGNLSIAKKFILKTSELPSDVLSNHGLNADDTDVASDHLPVVLDLSIPMTKIENWYLY